MPAGFGDLGTPQAMNPLAGIGEAAQSGMKMGMDLAAQKQDMEFKQAQLQIMKEKHTDDKNQHLYGILEKVTAAKSPAVRKGLVNFFTRQYKAMNGVDPSEDFTDIIKQDPDALSQAIRNIGITDTNDPTQRSRAYAKLLEAAGDPELTSKLWDENVKARDSLANTQALVGGRKDVATIQDQSKQKIALQQRAMKAKDGASSAAQLKLMFQGDLEEIAKAEAVQATRASNKETRLGDAEVLSRLKTMKAVPGGITAKILSDDPDEKRQGFIEANDFLSRRETKKANKSSGLTASQFENQRTKMKTMQDGYAKTSDEVRGPAMAMIEFAKMKGGVVDNAMMANWDHLRSAKASVLREGDIKGMKEMVGTLDKIPLFGQRLVDGSSLTTNQRMQMVQASRIMLKAQQEIEKQKSQGNWNAAKRLGINPEEVMTPNQLQYFRNGSSSGITPARSSTPGSYTWSTGGQTFTMKEAELRALIRKRGAVKGTDWAALKEKFRTITGKGWSD